MLYELWDPVLIARIQFAFVISFHIIFPSFTIGLASWLAVVEGLWLKTNDKKYAEIYKFWVKIFAVCFGMGVVSGVVMSYQFGTNWSEFSDKVGNVIGPLLGYEVLTAFFLESSFLGVMLFGWNKVSKKMHFISTIIVAIGTLISAFWILAANSWMQTPQGFEIGNNGILYPTNWMEVLFNPSFIYRFLHMVTATYLTTAFAVGGVGAYYLLTKRLEQHARVMLGMAMIMAIFVTPIQVLIGDQHGLNTLEHQPTKIAAIEGIWHTEKGAGLRLFAIPDQKNQTNHYEIIIPKLGSLILTHSWDGEIKGLNEWPENDQPPVAIVFWSFRIMVSMGLLMLCTGITAAYLYLRKRLFTTRWFHIWCVLMAPSGFIAVLAGWFVTEVGRQPWTVYGVVRTLESVSPVIAVQVAITLSIFFITYMVVFGAGIYYIFKLIRNGKIIEDEKSYYGHSIEASVTKELAEK